MPPLAAFAITAATTIATAAGPILTTLAAAAPAIAPVVSGVMGMFSQQPAQTAAAAEEARAAAIYQQELEFREKQAGEYFELTKGQMALQAQAAQIQTLANILEERMQPARPLVFALPAAKEYGPIENINRAIGNLLKVA